MEKYIGKLAVVTGTSSGSGEAIARALMQHGVNVVGMARRIDILEKLAEETSNSPQYKGKFYPVKCDLTKDGEIASSFQWIFDNIGSVHILVNNAAVCFYTYITDATSEQISSSLDLNIKAAILCSKAVVKNMAENKIDGHILNINALLGQVAISVKPNVYMLYSSTKHALRIISEGLRREMIEKRLNIKVTNFSPGYVRTEMTRDCRSHLLPREYDDTILEPEDVAQGCMTVINMPPNVLISEYLLLPLNLKY